MAKKRRPSSGGNAPLVAAAAPPRATTRRQIVAAVSAAVVLAALAGAAWLWSRPPRTDAEARRRLAGRRPAPKSLNVIVVTLDTLRADRLGCYGFPGVETPNLDALAAEGVVFEQATATVPLTLPSHASIFTGLVPPHHGVRDNGGYVLEEHKTTLAERLQKAGWTTGAFVGAWVLESRWGLAQGFDHYADKFDLSQYKTVSLGTVQKKGDEVMGLALDWLAGVKSKQFFAWVHLYDPHTPYDGVVHEVGVRGLAVLAEALAVVADHEHDRAVPQLRLAQEAQEAPQHLVGVGDLAQVLLARVAGQEGLR